jgi:hypothetical protein
MRMKKPYIATLDQVRISRQGEYGIIEYREPNLSSVQLKIGPEVQEMSDQEILDQHNQFLQAQLQKAAEYEHVAFEIPVGRPQIEFSKTCQQWTPRGDVLRCEISDGGPNLEAVIYIDDKELSLAEFGRLLTTYAGWGMRIVFVPDDRIDEEPEIIVLDPDMKANHLK